MRLLPASATPDAGRILMARALRALGDGWISILLPVYLLELGFDALRVGILASATLLGSAAMTIAVGFLPLPWGRRTLLVASGFLMAATGFAFASLETFVPLLLVAMIGTLNPSSGDVSVFQPLEHALLPDAVADKDRTALFARYAFVGSALGALGTLAAGAPDWLAEHGGFGRIGAIQAMFALYGAIGLAQCAIHRTLAVGAAAPAGTPRARLGPSRRIVVRLAMLFSIDSFGGGLVVQSLVAFWLYDRFQLSLTATATIFFWANLASAISFLVAAPLARRIGLVNTMVFTHLPANLCLAAMAFFDDLDIVLALFLVRSLLSQLDVPTRSSYVVAVVTPEERTAAASLTAVPRSLAAALGPMLGGALLQVSPFGWFLLLAGVLKAGYDLALFAMFRAVKPPEER